MTSHWWKAILGWTSSTLLVLLVLQNSTPTSYACNEAICASVVSKCMLTGSCKCDLVTCTCCKECFSCLSYLYDECCSCVDLCPKPNVTANPLSKKSHVEDFSEPVPGLFQALTSDPDPHERWLTFTFPVDFDVSLFSPKREKEVNYHMQTVEQEVQPMKPNVMTLNCTVAYMAQCNSWNKCKASCQSMGATSYRWFHDGCCECIGDTCINYGINESRCPHCPQARDLRDDLKNQYDDYGEDELLDEDFD
ncbi:twisted gastrulation protein homolog 1-A-like isoform X1 [Athalia rosae]|uniref:BMP binding protein n=1 Tax=Athalia rosae TaxID=37344 RepID=F8QYE7_ATHRO|nr:twisted gastrulation protein homolog 1-A-like precursor [Athalia rosae]XP_012267029.1 twisted gastrulation protein homolog 1-A-like isoform X1 [Athalia rosae]XP_012267030.1 twisted gastrulation protein homolog 1-A-like isoform X1 [Athalia rosae]XP_012267031.1 twisted gastrulation protein homolog 1-A-like isoform X1 [Athalia rosae]XP_012267034.1 twisted gastrulation protein homolog 1-A-like isoform X1 [Athalia rosae]XP_012267035.1 twisted gastrulation protein homolog 1-A-like isoform X1 [Ath